MRDGRLCSPSSRIAQCAPTHPADVYCPTLAGQVSHLPRANPKQFMKKIDGQLAGTQPFDLRGLRYADTGMPKYLQLRNSLAEAISKGRLKRDEKLPTDDQITHATGLSLGTVQKALKALADAGQVVRRQGKGTFVAQGEAPMSAPFYHCRFLDDSGELLPIFPRLVRRGPAATSGEWSKYLPGPDIYCIERTFSINKEFSIYVRLYFDARRLPMLAKAPDAKLNGANMKSLITREAHLPLARFSESMAVLVFPRQVCKAIGVAAGTSGAVLEVIARDPKGDAVYFQEHFVPPTRRRLFIAA
jgi:GntR family transcriptional regulator